MPAAARAPVTSPAGPGGLSQLDGRPVLAVPAVEKLLAQAWGVIGQVRPLESERDQNWLVAVAGVPRFVLKIANRAEDPAVLGLQQALMARLLQADLPCPRVVPTTSGEQVAQLDGHHTWMIELLPGAKLAEVPEPSDGVLHDLGRVLGRAANALDGFDHPAAHRHLQWDVTHGEQVLTAYRPSVSDPARGALLDQALEGFRRHVAPALATLPRAVIHNDANDHNVLVTGDQVTGLIDFGDAVHTVAVNELAIACAYAMLNRRSPWDTVAAVTAGFASARPLTEPERTLLPHLIRTRLATSVSVSAYQQTLAPQDDYLRVSEAPVWRLLARIAKEHP